MTRLLQLIRWILWPVMHQCVACKMHFSCAACTFGKVCVLEWAPVIICEDCEDEHVKTHRR